MLMDRHQKLQGLTVGSRQQQIELRLPLCFKLKPVIDRVSALTELAAAFQHEEKGAHFGKLCIQI